MEPRLWEEGEESRLRGILGAKPLCLRCAGRLFARVGTGLTNEERGRKVLPSLGLDDAGKDCWLCQGLIGEIPKFADLVMKSLSTLEFETFLVGCRIDPDVLDREEMLWAEAELRTYEPLKAEVNREIGKIVEARLGKRVEFSNPTVTAVVDTMLDHVDLQVSPLFLYGRYRKLIRGIPQTKWLCRTCRGVGCERCDDTGKMYETSVEEIVAEEAMKQSEGDGHSFHGMGREDIDARMLGRGRPFVLEVARPRRRTLDLKAIARRVNRTGMVEVLDLRPSSRAEVVSIKGRVCEKSYRLLVKLGRGMSLQKLKEAVEALKASKIVQRTPTRVVHRRTDIERVRWIPQAEVTALSGDVLELRLRAEAGTYLKELIHGDEGRTRPSLAELLGASAEVVELDVLEIHDEGYHGQSLQGAAEEDEEKAPQETSR